MGNPRWHGGKESACQCRRLRFDPWVGKIPWGWKWQPTPVFLPGKFQGQRSLVGYSPRGPKSQTWLSTHTEKMWPFADRWEGDFYYFLSAVNQFRSLTHFESISGGQVFWRKIFQMAIYALQAFSRSWLDPTPGMMTGQHPSRRLYYYERSFFSIPTLWSLWDRPDYWAIWQRELWVNKFVFH